MLQRANGIIWVLLKQRIIVVESNEEQKAKTETFKHKKKGKVEWNVLIICWKHLCCLEQVNNDINFGINFKFSTFTILNFHTQTKWSRKTTFIRTYKIFMVACTSTTTTHYPFSSVCSCFHHPSISKRVNLSKNTHSYAYPMLYIANK